MNKNPLGREPSETITLSTSDYPLLQSNGAIIKNEHCVTISFSGMKNLTPQAMNTLLYVPESLRPATNITLQVPSVDFAEMYRFILETSGRLSVYPYQTVTRSTNLPLAMTYAI